MPIPPAHVNRSIYHFTHIDNLEGLLKTGFLAKNHSDFPESAHRSVAADGIQARRAKMKVTCGLGGVVHDYVPLYFGSVSPMLLSVVNQKNVDQMEIIYFEFSIDLVNRNDVVFTDASANTEEPPKFYFDSSDLNKLNWEEIDSRKWSCDDDTHKHQRMAEVLVYSHLPLQSSQRIVVWNKTIKEFIAEMAKKEGVELPSIGFEDSYVRPHYFTNFMEGKKNQSLVIGPNGIASRYKSSCKLISEKTDQPENAPFETPKKLLVALRNDFSCIQQTAELIGLKSANGMHKLTVDAHTHEVVKKLKSLDEFTELAPEYKDRVELAAYLHDIGKGPKSRWVKNNGIQKVDPNHAVSAMPMIVDILTNQVKKVKQENAELILKLVCYHDLVGEVLGKGRDEQQLVDVANNELELKMLFAIGKADATSLVENWWDEGDANRLYSRCLAAINERGDL